MGRKKKVVATAANSGGGDSSGKAETVAEKKRRRKERRKLKRSNKNRQYAKMAGSAQAALERSRSEATTILLEGLEPTEWDLINDSISGVVPNDKADGGLTSRKEPLQQKFCRLFELASLNLLALIGIMSFAYFSYRYVAPYEVCVCAERRLRDCDGLTDTDAQLCLSGLDNSYELPFGQSFFVDSVCDDYFDGDLNVDIWYDLTGASSCFRQPYVVNDALCEDTCYVLNELPSRSDPASDVDRLVRDAYGFPEYAARWSNPDETAGDRGGFWHENEHYTHMWTFPGTYPTSVTSRKAYFFAIVSIFSTLLAIIAWMEEIKGYDPNKKNVGLIALAITLVLVVLLLFSVYIIIDDAHWRQRYTRALESVQTVLSNGSASVIFDAAQLAPNISDAEWAEYAANAPAESVVLETTVYGQQRIVAADERDESATDVHRLDESALTGLLVRSWLPYIVEPCLNYLDLIDDTSAAALVVGLDITSKECQCTGIDCMHCPQWGSLSPEEQYAWFGEGQLCSSAAAGDWICPVSNETDFECQETVDPLRLKFQDMKMDLEMETTEHTVPVLTVLILFAAMRYLSVLIFTIRVMRFRADQCYNCHMGFTAARWPFKCKQCGYNFCEICLTHQRFLGADEAHIAAQNSAINLLTSKAAKRVADGENGRISAMVCGNCFQKTPANTLNMLTKASLSQNAAEGLKLLCLFHYDDCLHSWRIKRGKALGLNVLGKDEHGVDRVDSAQIEPPTREYMVTQVLQRIRRETGVFWFSGLDKAVLRAVHAMFDYYELKGGKYAFKDLLNTKTDTSNNQESPLATLRKHLAAIFPANFEREINSAIALDSVQQAEYKELVRRQTQAGQRGAKSSQVVPMSKVGGTVRQKKDGLPAVPERLRLEVLDFDLLKRPLTLTETLFEGLIMDTVAAGHIECPSDGDVARCRQVLADYWKLSHNDQGDFHQLQTFLSHFGSLYPTHKLLLDSATNKKLLKQLPGRARLLPQAVFTGVVCSFYEPSGFSHQNEGTKCDVFVFTDSIWFFRAKKSTLEKLNKAHYRCRSGEQHFLLLREDIAAVQEIGSGKKAKLVVESGAHSYVHTFKADEEQMDTFVESFYIWLSPINFSGSGRGDEDAAQDDASKGTTVDEVEDIPADGEENSLVVPELLNPQTTYECALRRHQVVQYFISGQEYFRAAAEAMLAAQESIYISASAIAPELYLVRDGGVLQEFRLDIILQRKARAGVAVRIVLAKTKFVEYVSTRLELLHENVEVVLRGPDRIGSTWSLHQNAVVIDSTVSFVGGIPFEAGQCERVRDPPDDDAMAGNSGLLLGHTPYRYPLSDTTEWAFPGSSYVNPLETDGMHRGHLVEWPFYSQGIFSDAEARTCTERMPNSQIMVAVLGEAAEDLARTFITMWNSLPENFKREESGDISQRLIRTLPVNMPNVNHVAFRNALASRGDAAALIGHCDVRCLRSCSPWAGFANAEASIHSQMLHLIKGAERTIHLETSSFVSFVLPQNKVHNRIARALFDRISTAIEQDQDFNVVLQIPVQQPSPLEDNRTLSGIMFTALSLYHGSGSLIAKLLERYFTVDDLDALDSANPFAKMTPKGRRLSDFLQIVTMYTTDNFRDRHKHTSYRTRHAATKPSNFVVSSINTCGTVLIVDDRLAVIGSHGISDRSLLGNRDSDVAVVLSDREKRSVAAGALGNQTAVVGTSIHRLRMRLWNKLLGLPLDDTKTTSNMQAKQVKLLLRQTAQRNAAILHRVFPSLQHSQYLTIDAFNKALVKKNESRPSEQQIKLFLKELRGTVAAFPVGFLGDEEVEEVVGEFGNSITKAQLAFV